MNSRSSRWVSGIGAVVLAVGGLVLAGCGSGDTPAGAQATPTDIQGVTQNWDKAIPSASRFVVLAAFNNAAVRDNNTGLVWEQSPASTTHTWFSATATCIDKSVGGQKGWRLPAIPELASLIDPTVAAPGPTPTLPAGHPFTNVQSAFYWSASTLADNPSFAWDVLFNNGNVSNLNKTGSSHAWCVRGGMQADQY